MQFKDTFSLRRAFKCAFIVCEVKQQIIVADILLNFKLTVNLCNNRIVDLGTSV